LQPQTVFRANARAVYFGTAARSTVTYFLNGACELRSSVQS